jgi:sugar (pentulose or hexulose) kinase
VDRWGTVVPNLVGLDLGTTTVTGVLLDAERGQVLRLARRPNDSALRPSLSTRAEQAPRRLRALALEVLAEIAAAGDPVGGIALTGQKHGLLCAGAGGEPLSPLISWQDRRTAEPLPDGSTTLDQLRARLGGLDWHENGCRIQHGYGAATLFWLLARNGLPPGTHWVCTVADWLAGQLAGLPPVTDPTFAASWGLYDVVRGAWNVAFLDRLGLAAWLFPPIRPSAQRLGGLLPEVARQVGLPAGLAVFNTLGDTQASYLGSVVRPDDSILFNLGTGGQVCWLVPEFEPPTEAVETRPLPGDRYLRVGASLSGGAAYAWLNRTVRAWLTEFGLEAGEEAVYERLNALATACYDTGDLRVQTTFLGVRGNPAIQAGSIKGLSLDELRLGTLARATLTGIVDELRDLHRAHAGGAARHTQVIATGGGVWGNPLMPGLIEERFGLPVQIPAQRETAAVGAAVRASHAVAT